MEKKDGARVVKEITDEGISSLFRRAIKRQGLRDISPKESFLILDNWLDQCDMMKALGYNKHTLIKNKLRYVNNYKPISHERLKKENNELYNKIVV